ncbi:MAG: hypothetical protein LBJ64_08235 [Deltaproteobacteria bacterium]|jgi:hypothetical protein|nr:hypothetical protein [Deltaproteobacteria bacterium]
MRKVKRKYLKKPWEMPADDENYPPRPWEVARGRDPAIFRCTQGYEEYWHSYIWMPFWCAMSVEQQEEISKEAPDQTWAEWLEFGSSFCEEFLQEEQLKKDAEKDFPQYYYYYQQPGYEIIGLLGIPLAMAFIIVVSSFPIVDYMSTMRSFVVRLFVSVFWYLFICCCTGPIIKLFKMRSEQMAVRLILIGCGLGYVISLLFMNYIVGSNLGPIDFLANRLSQGFFIIDTVRGSRLILVKGIELMFYWLVEMSLIMFCATLAVSSQVMLPYSTQNRKWCPRIKLPLQILVTDKDGFTPYENTGGLMPFKRVDRFDPNEYEMLDGIILPKKADPVGFFRSFFKPTLRIIIFQDDANEFDYISLIFRRGVTMKIDGIPLRAICKSTSSTILKKYSKQS